MNREIRLSDFESYFPYAPTALCIKECARLSALREYPCEGPILDVGCGDGLFAKLAYGGAEVWGIDIDAVEGGHAQASRAYSQVILADVTRAWMPEGFFKTCVANCSLEHVPQIGDALRNICKALQPGGRALLFVPNRDWASHLLSVQVLKRAGLPRIGRIAQDLIDQVFKHHHLYDEQGWRELVESAGFEVEAIKPVGSTASTMAFEAFLIPSLAGLLNKRMTTRWTNFPNARRALAPLAYAAVTAALTLAADDAPTAEYLLVLRRPRA